MQIAGNRVAAPNDDEFGLRKKLHPHADLGAQGIDQPSPPALEQIVRSSSEAPML